MRMRTTLAWFVFAICPSGLFGCAYNDPGEATKISNPMIEVRYSQGLFGVNSSAKVGTSFLGHGELQRNPETGQIDLIIIDVESRPEPVIDAEAARAQAMTEMYAVYSTSMVEMHRLVGENIKAFNTIIATLADILRGSGISVDTPLGSGELNLGTPPGVGGDADP